MERKKERWEEVAKEKGWRMEEWTCVYCGKEFKLFTWEYFWGPPTCPECEKEAITHSEGICSVCSGSISLCNGCGTR